MQDIVSALRGIEFFHNIPDEYLNRVATISRIVEFPGRHDIFREHESAKDVYFIISGRVSLVICAPPFGCRQLMEVTAGELIGWKKVGDVHQASSDVAIQAQAAGSGWMYA
jgi:CRP-like cAMP-binding protein